MALKAQQDIFFVAFMALRAFDVAAFGYMVLVRILIEVFCPLSHRLQRFMAFETCLRCCRCCRLFLGVARIAREVSFLVTVCGKAGLFLGCNDSS